MLEQGGRAHCAGHAAVPGSLTARAKVTPMAIARRVALAHCATRGCRPAIASPPLVGQAGEKIDAAGCRLTHYIRNGYNRD
jgi:hypothetical protein